MSSREEFMRQMGITTDDVVDPTAKGCKTVPEGRSSARSSVRSPPIKEGVPVPMGRSNSRRQTREEFISSLGISGNDEAAEVPQAPPRAPAGGAPRSAADRAAFMREMGIDNAGGPAPEAPAPVQPVRPVASRASPGDRAAFMQMGIENASDPAPAEPPVRASAKPSGGGSRADFLRQMGIENADQPAPVDAPSRTPPRAARAAPSGDRAAFLREMGIDNAGGAPPPELPKTTPAANRETFMREMGIERGARNATGSQEYPRSAAVDLNTSASGAGVSRRDSARVAMEALRRDSDEAPAGGAYNATMESAKENLYLGRRSGSKPPPSSNNALEAELLGLREDASPEDIKNMGNKFFQGGDYRKAVRLYSKAIERDVNNAALYSNRSAAYLLGTKQMGIDTRTMALRDADKVIKLQPGWFKGYSRRGDALFKLERFDEAVETYRRALEIDPDNSSVQHSLEECERYAKPALTSSTKQSWTVSSAPECPKTASSFRAPAGDKTAHEMLAELQQRREKETPDLALRGNDWRAKELERFRTRGGSRQSSETYDCAPPPPPPDFGDAEPAQSKLERTTIPEEFSSDAAADYQASLLESFRKKKAMRSV